MTNSKALGTARTLRVHLQSIQARLDMVPPTTDNPSMGSAKALLKLSLQDATELERFLEELQEKTLNPQVDQ